MQCSHCPPNLVSFPTRPALVPLEICSRGVGRRVLPAPPPPPHALSFYCNKLTGRTLLSRHSRRGRARRNFDGPRVLADGSVASSGTERRADQARGHSESGCSPTRRGPRASVAVRSTPRAGCAAGLGLAQAPPPRRRAPPPRLPCGPRRPPRQPNPALNDRRVTAGGGLTDSEGGTGAATGLAPAAMVRGVNSREPCSLALTAP